MLIRVVHRMLLCACALIFRQVSAKVITLPQDIGDIWGGAGYASGDHAGRSRVARSAQTSSSLLDNWQMANEAFQNINGRLRTYDVRSADAGGIRFNLAVSFGNLNSASARMMDDKLKVMIAGTLRTFNRNPALLTSWDSIMATMKNNPLLEEVIADRIHREDGYGIDEHNYFKFDGSARQEQLERFSRWFSRFLSDHDVQQDTSIDVNALARIVSETGATVNSFRTLFARHQEDEMNVIDIGILRFPDLDHPFMKIYRIQLKVWQSSRRVLFYQRDQNGVKGFFDSAKFRPRESVMADLRRHIVERARAEVDDIFS